MPGPGQDLFDMAWNLLTEPVFKGLLWGALLEFNRPGRPSDRDDESIGSFLNRRLGSAEPANNIVSAVLHGIYAGDVYKLSVKSLIPIFWEREGRHGSISQGILRERHNGMQLIAAKDKDVVEELSGLQNGDENSIGSRMKQASVYTFEGGLGSFADAIAASLRANPNVQIKTGQKIKSVAHDEASKSITVGPSPSSSVCVY